MSRLKDARTFWSVLRALLAAAALLFLVRAIVTRWSQVTAYPWQLHVIPLLGSFFLQLVAAFFWATVWWRMVIRAGSPIPWREGVWAYLISNLARYVPGSIWGYVSRVHLARDLTAVGAGISVVWEVGMAIVASLLLTAAAFPFYPGELPVLVFRLVLVVALVCLVGLLPPIANRWMALLNRRSTAQQDMSYGWSDFMVFLSAALTTHILVGSAFFLFTRSVVNVGAQHWWSFVAIWSFSATAGLVVILVPYGLGVKEGTLALLMGPFLALESIAPIALASRLWTIIGELLAAGVVVIVYLTAGRQIRSGALGIQPQDHQTGSNNP